VVEIFLQRTEKEKYISSLILVYYKDYSKFFYSAFKQDLPLTMKMAREVGRNLQSNVLVPVNYSKNYNKYSLFPHDLWQSSKDKVALNEDEELFLLAIDIGAIQIAKWLLKNNKINLPKLVETIELFLIVSTAERNALDIVKSIVETRKVDINNKDGLGRSPLLVAVENSNFNVVEYLVSPENHVDFNVLNDKKQNILQIAVKNGAAEIVNCLVNTGKFFHIYQFQKCK
jgi:Ankyrin repeats (3 copies)